MNIKYQNVQKHARQDMAIDAIVSFLHASSYDDNASWYADDNFRPLYT